MPDEDEAKDANFVRASRVAGVGAIEIPLPIEWREARMRARDKDKWDFRIHFFLNATEIRVIFDVVNSDDWWLCYDMDRVTLQNPNTRTCSKWNHIDATECEKCKQRWKRKSWSFLNDGLNAETGAGRKWQSTQQN